MDAENELSDGDTAFASALTRVLLDDETPSTDLFALAQERAVHRRSSRRRGMIAIAVAAAVAAVAVITTIDLDDGRDPVDTFESRESPPSTPEPTVAGIVVTRPPTATTIPDPTTTTTEAPTTTSVLVCRNSTNPACGPFRWEPAPGANAPIRFDLSGVPSTATVGKPVTFRVRVTDADGGDLNCANLFPGGPVEEPILGGGCQFFNPSDSCGRFGAWDLKPDAMAATSTFTFTYTAPGTYHVQVQATSIGTDPACTGTYGATDATARIQITVQPAPPTSTTTSTSTTAPSP